MRYSGYGTAEPTIRFSQPDRRVGCQEARCVSSQLAPSATSRCPRRRSSLPPQRRRRRADHPGSRWSNPGQGHGSARARPVSTQGLAQANHNLRRTTPRVGSSDVPDVDRMFRKIDAGQHGRWSVHRPGAAGAAVGFARGDSGEVNPMDAWTRDCLVVAPQTLRRAEAPCAQDQVSLRRVRS
jgi:hypothetical protein